ncbi:MAG: ABC transporter ATP-binding protein [Alphaproteobacteria bacterium]|nr:ABC transporter ATP-binding protein [Alphaproteobacteria bacterium]
MSDQQTNPVISIKNLSVDFALRRGPFRAVSDVSFDLYPGKTLCLVGESGSGKTVTGRALMQIISKPGVIVEGSISLVKPDGATVDIAQLDPRGKEIREFRGGDIAMIFQEPMSSMSPVHTIGSQIIEAILQHSKMSKAEARTRTIELLASVDISEPELAIDRYPFEYSGGMLQRAMIAMALSAEPRILIADEPTTALDVTTQAEILDLVKRLQVEHGMAVLLITHDMGIVAEVADEVVVMRHGKIVEHRSVDDMFHDPQHAYTKQLLASTMKLEAGAANAAKAVDDKAKPILSVRNLSKFYGTEKNGVQAVDDVSFDLLPGKTLGIVGESGSGKTTLGRLILRIVEPTTGAVSYRDRDGQDVDVIGLNKKRLRDFHADVRLIFQDPYASLNPRMTVREIIGDPLLVNGRLRGEALKDKVTELLDLVGLEPEVMERYPHAFSGGQRQRIGIARALSLEPRVIIADEATSALDVSIRSQILDLLLDLQKRLNLSFVFISHDISVVRYFCDDVLVMHYGKLVESGTAEQICTDPQQAYTKSLISAVPNPDPRNKRMMHRTRFDVTAN